LRVAGLQGDEPGKVQRLGVARLDAQSPLVFSSRFRKGSLPV
jgi:hypothetical protein